MIMEQLAGDLPLSGFRASSGSPERFQMDSCSRWIAGEVILVHETSPVHGFTAK